MAELKISNDLQNVIKKIVLNTYYPVGKIYITVGNENPNETIGGTWIKFGVGRCLVGVDTSQKEFNIVEKIGGEKTHKLTIEEMPNHNHKLSRFYNQIGFSMPFNDPVTGWGLKNDDVNGVNDIMTTYSGGGQSHNNLQPYITVYMWKRTA